jgi:hypothetical protein
MKKVVMSAARLVPALGVLLLGAAPTGAGQEWRLAQPQLREMAAEMAEGKAGEKTVAFTKANFRVVDKTLLYNFGGVTRGERVEKDVSKRPPLQIVLDRQFMVLAIDRGVEGEKDRALWKPYLDRVDVVLGKELAAIRDTDGNRPALAERLASLDQEAGAILKVGVEAYAKSMGLMARARGSYGAGIFPVSLTTAPAGGTVYYLSAMEYEMFKRTGQPDQVDGWRRLWNEGQGTIQIGGNFFFRVAWPQGRFRRTGKYAIKGPQKLSFEPEN